MGSDPASSDFQVRDLQLPVPDERFTRRQRVLNVVNTNFNKKQNADSVKAMNSFYERAYSLIGDQNAKDAFDIEKEPANIRDKYGRNTAGARMLLARRLVEFGTRFVTLTYGGWDMHDNIANGMNSQLPAFDQGFASLIEDLDQRGLLESTLVCVVSEFGRTPKINNRAGRDHWPKVFSTVLAGGGIKGGMTYGTSNATASEPDQNPVNIEDWAATIYNRLGIVADKELMAPGDRPIEIVDGGKILTDIIV